VFARFSMDLLRDPGIQGVRKKILIMNLVLHCVHGDRSYSAPKAVKASQAHPKESAACSVYSSIFLLNLSCILAEALLL
jgi:hypothetical protein